MMDTVKKAYKLLMHPEHKHYFDFVRFDSLTRDFEQGNYVLVRDDEKEVVGLVTIHIYKTTSPLYKVKKGDIRIKQIVVHPRFKGTGLALKLFNEVKELAIKKKALHVCLSVEKDNDRANAFYKKLGMKVVNEGSWNRHGTDTPFNVYRLELNETTHTFW